MVEKQGSDIKERKKRIKSPYLKKRVSIVCNCKRKKSNENNRKKFGTCRCDSYSLSWTLAVVIANSLYQYLEDAKRAIIRDDWDEIEKHANAIMEYANADSWDLLSKESGVKSLYKKKERDFKKAMRWLTDNLGSLWW